MKMYIAHDICQFHFNGIWLPVYANDNREILSINNGEAP